MLKLDIQTLTTGEAAEVLQVTVRTIYNYIDAGELKATKIGGKYRITLGELERFINEGTSEEYRKENRFNYAKKKAQDEDGE